MPAPRSRPSLLLPSFRRWSSARAHRPGRRGLELELTAAPTRGLTLGANLGYTDFKYTGTLNWEVLITAGLCAAEFGG